MIKYLSQDYFYDKWKYSVLSSCKTCDRCEWFNHMIGRCAEIILGMGSANERWHYNVV